MKSTIYLLIACIALTIVACQPDKKPVSNTVAPNPQLPTIDAPAATTAVQHYTCPNNCAGSGAAQAGSCPVCGTAYVHNAAYHNQPGANTTNPQMSNSPIIINQQPGAAQQTTVPNPQVQPTEEPAQNAAGVWHFVCSKGCSGGSGKRGYCPKCGAGMDHNEAYHR